ncbi:MAG: hypothetical protein II450_05985 [Prevotella sp.]|nr:hypothetical protein [Prevotella sp.]
MNKIKTFILLIAMITTAISADAENAGAKKKKRPEGRPIYCSYSITRPAGQGKDFCEFVADKEDSITVVVCLNANSHFERQTRCEFVPIPETYLTRLWNLLDDIQPWKFDGYEKMEEGDGAPIYRIFMEYSDGRECNARWSTSKPRSDVVKAYQAIEKFFTQWRQQF